jgi:molybdate transport system substrate-binding protein
VIGAALSSSAQALELKVLTAGAFRSSVITLGPEYEKASGNKLIIDNDTVGGLVKRVEAGETFDVIFLTPAAVDELAAKGKMAPFSLTNLARVGVGVMVKEARPSRTFRPSTPSRRRCSTPSRSPTSIPPAALQRHLCRQAPAAPRHCRPGEAKEKLKHGGYVADLISSGESELGIHQISEIIPAKGVTFVGPLPKEIRTIPTMPRASVPTPNIRTRRRP